MELIYQTTSPQGKIRVYEEGTRRFLRLGNGTEIHSLYDARDILINIYEESYWNYFTLLPHLTKVRRILLIGFGAGTMARQYAHYHPSVHIDGVEVDGEIERVAREHMGLHTTNYTLYTMDGLDYLARCRRHYDAIILDAFVDGNLNKRFLNVRTFAYIKRLLREGGIFVTNYFDQGGVPFLVKRAMKNTFAHIIRIPIPGTYNYIAFASDASVDLQGAARTITDAKLSRIARYASTNKIVDR